MSNDKPPIRIIIELLSGRVDRPGSIFRKSRPLSPLNIAISAIRIEKECGCLLAKARSVFKQRLESGDGIFSTPPS